MFFYVHVSHIEASFGELESKVSSLRFLPRGAIDPICGGDPFDAACFNFKLYLGRPGTSDEVPERLACCFFWT